MPRRVLEFFRSWGASFRYGPVNEVWWLVLLCLIWFLWREWKTQHFDGVETSMLELPKAFA
jgi:hypothetical protein